MVRDGATGVDEFLIRTFGWRALLRFDFFFDDSAEFRETILEELELACPDGVGCLERGEFDTLLEALAPFTTPAVLRPFLEAYRLVADVLVRAEPGEELTAEEIRGRALALGREYEVRGKITTPESLSFALFDAGSALAANTGVLDAAAAHDDRVRFLADLEDALSDIEALEAARRPQASL